MGLLAAQTPPNPPQFADMMPDFNAIALNSDGKTAWAAGDNGLIYHSIDGGTTWTWADMPGSGALLGLHFNIDGTLGWVVGEGRIAYSNDRGSTWREVQNVPRVNLRKVLFDAQGKHGFAVGDVVLETADGGISWKQRDDPELKSDGGFDAIAFDPEWKGGIIGGPNGLLQTEDGGRSWKKQPGKFHDIVKVWTDGIDWVAISMPTVSGQGETRWFRNGSTREWSDIWDAGARDIQVQYTHDVATLAGEHGIFSERRNQYLTRVFEGNYYDLVFATERVYGLAHSTPERIGLAVGQSGLVARTEDGGQTWQVIHQWPAIGTLYGVVVQANLQRIWAVGPKVWRSDDGGRSFKERTLPKVPLQGGFAEGVMNVKFTQDGRLGWMTSAGGAILRTTDGGESWTPAAIVPPSNREIYTVSFAPDGQRGIGVGYDGIFMTADGGANWKLREAPSALNGVSFTNSGHTAFAVGPSGRIWRSEDWGGTWKQIPSGTEATLYGVLFTAAGRLGWIWGGAVKDPEFPSTILRTENGGRTWAAASIAGTAEEILSIRDLWFDADGRYGWAATDVGMLRSVDSGRTWDQVPGVLAGTWARNWPNITAFTLTGDGKHGWAVGHGFMLETAHQTQLPQITRFEVGPPDFELSLEANDPDTPSAEVSGTIDVEGEGLELVADKLRRTFKLADAEGVQWSKDIFRKGVNYTFHLRLSDGWNVVTRDFTFGTPTNPTSAPSVSLDLTELRGVQLSGLHVSVDGQDVQTAQILTRGGNGNVSLTPSAAILQKLPDGFHALTVTRSGQEIVKRIGFYKEQLTLKLFRPYGTSYALIIAIGDYAPESGYRKLPNAVPQARELEKTLREQGFTSLPALYDRDATRSRIEAAIRSAPAGPEDRLFVYFGGHGDDEKGFQGKAVGYLVPYDGRKSDLWGTAIPLEKVAGEYSSRLRAKHVLFALDSCQSGLAVSRGSPLDLKEEELRRFKALAEIETLSGEPGRTILTAGTGGQDALDVSGGIFTAALTDSIRGKADADRNGVVDYFELFAYVWGRVNAEARQWIRKQQPADYQLGNGRWVFVYH